MSFITIEEAETILGKDFADDGDKASLIKLANTWLRNEIGYLPLNIDPLLKDAACEIIKGIISGDIYSGIERQTTSESVKADSVQTSESFAEGSRVISKYEQVARAYIDSLDIKSKGFSFEVYRR